MPGRETDMIKEVGHDGSYMKLRSGRVIDQQSSRVMKCNAATEGRSRSRSTLGEPTSHALKWLKGSSLAERRPSSKCVFNIRELPDEVLVEILCRLPSYEFVFQCKCVSKRWCSLISDPHFIGRFLYLQSDKETPIICTFVTDKGEEFLHRTPLSKLLSRVLKRIKVAHALMEEPILVQTHNDLVLCCASKRFQRDYYICNPYTMQWIALPPPPAQCHERVRVGFICDVPYYSCKKDDWKGQFIQLNAEYRCRVVRILRPDVSTDDHVSKINLEIFSSETGQWRASVASSPRSLTFCDFTLVHDLSFAYNGMLYWQGLTFLFGLDPFDNRGGDEFCFTVFDEILDPYTRYGGVSGGCVRMCKFCYISKTLCVWELQEKDDDDGEMANETTSRKLYLSGHKVYYLDQNMYGDMEFLLFGIGYDPRNEDILYLKVNSDIFVWNIHTGKWSKRILSDPLPCHFGLPLVQPWWPTPVPRLPEHAYHQAYDPAPVFKLPF